MSIKCKASDLIKLLQKTIEDCGDRIVLMPGNYPIIGAVIEDGESVQLLQGDRIAIAKPPKKVYYP